MYKEDRQEQAHILYIVIAAVILMLVIAMAWGGTCAYCKASDNPIDFLM